MRSYLYTNGIWQLYKDPLSQDPDYREFPHTNHISDLDVVRAAHAEYQRELQTLGFPLEGDSLFCQLGKMQVFARDHTKLPPNRREKEVPDFFCVIKASGSYMRVWIPDLPNLFLFLREVEASHPEKDALVSYLKRFEDDSSLIDMVMYLNYVLKNIWNGNLEITVRSPQED